MFFTHVTIVIILVKLFCVKKYSTQHSLVYTSKTKGIFKKFILLTSLFFNNHVVTASNSSFPYKSKKLNAIGHAIDYELF